MELRKGGDANDWFFLAMAHWQLGEKEKARQWHDRAAQWMDDNKEGVSNTEELRRFRAESAELLGVSKQQTSLPPASRTLVVGRSPSDTSHAERIRSPRYSPAIFSN